MSYILSALRKAERDRRLGKVPDLSEPEWKEEDASADNTKRKISGFVIGLGVLIAVNAALLLRFDTEPTVAGGHVPPELNGGLPSDEAAPAPKKDWRQSEVPKLVAPAKAPKDLAEQPKQPIKLEKTNGQPDESKAAGELINYADLPASVRNQLPPLDISGYVFIPNQPQLSRIIINGRSVRVGQVVADDLRVSEITADAVIFSVDGQRFSLSMSNLF